MGFVINTIVGTALLAGGAYGGYQAKAYLDSVDPVRLETKADGKKDLVADDQRYSVAEIPAVYKKVQESEEKMQAAKQAIGKAKQISNQNFVSLENLLNQ